MMVFPSMLVSAAREAGMRIPSNPDEFDAREYPHFAVFCSVQLCRPMAAGEHWDNARIIANIPSDEIMKVNLLDLIARGLMYS